MKALNFIRDMGVNGLLDIILMTLIIYILLVWFRRSKALFILMGIFMVGIVYLIARQFNLLLTAAVFQGFFTVILLAMIIIFQEDLKYLFEKVAAWSLNRGVSRKKLARLGRPEVEILVRTLTDFAHDRTGALLVIRGRDIIDRHLVGGIDINGEISEPLVKSIFDPHSPGHDGAMILEQERVTKFSCHLPLSKDIKKIGRNGTRHAAALGLAELSDALCIVVSEEHGTISIAHTGEIFPVTDPDQLSAIIENFYQEAYPLSRSSFVTDLLKKNYRELGISFIATILLWFIFVHESQIMFKKYTIRLGYTNLPEELYMAQFRPTTVDVTFSGKRTSFYFVNPNQLSIMLNMGDTSEGTHALELDDANVTAPKEIKVESISPDKVKFLLLPKTFSKKDRLSLP